MLIQGTGVILPSFDCRGWALTWWLSWGHFPLLRPCFDGVGYRGTSVAMPGNGGGFNLALTLPSFFPNPYRKLTVNIGRTLVVILGLFLPWFFPGSAVAFPLRFRCGTVVVRLLIRNAAPLFYGCRICRIFACSSPVQPLFYRCRICRNFRRFLAASTPFL